MRHHQHPDPARGREDRPEHKADDRGLLGAGESLIWIAYDPEQRSGQDDDSSFPARSVSGQLAKAFE